MIISYDNDSLIFDMHIMMKLISRCYHAVITKISVKYQNSNSQSNDILSRYFDKPQYCTLVAFEVLKARGKLNVNCSFKLGKKMLEYIINQRTVTKNVLCI